jgi:hypothetical protein
MIKITLDDRTIEIPSEMTIRQYQIISKYKDILTNSPVKLLAIYLGLSEDELKDLPVDKVKFVERYISTQYTNLQKNLPLIETFEYNGVEYGLEKEWGELSWGAWVDFEVFCAEKPLDHIHNIMAILYRPIETKSGDKYTIVPYKSKEITERGEIFKELPVKYWWSAANFFLRISELYISSIKNSLERTLKMNRLILKGWKMLPKFLKRRWSLDSILVSHTSSVEKTLQSLNR